MNLEDALMSAWGLGCCYWKTFKIKDQGSEVKSKRGRGGRRKRKARNAQAARNARRWNRWKVLR